MRILGIDPGTVVVGFGCLDIVSVSADAVATQVLPMAHRVANVVRGPARGGTLRLVEAGVLRLGRKTDPLPDRLLDLARQIAALFARLAPGEMALEEAFFGKSVQAALRIGEARGVILAEARRHGIEVFQFAPATVKRIVAGHGAASKDAVADMARRQVGMASAPTARDASDALAVALTRAESRRSPGHGRPCNPDLADL